MNLFAPQSPESVVELKELCHVLHHIISPRLGSPIIGLCQDGQLGAYLITGDDVRMTRDQVQQLMMFNNQFDGVLPEPGDKERGLWTGKQVFSMLLPKTVNYRNDDGVVIENGQLLKGRCSDKVTGAKAGGIIHMLYNDVSPQAAMDFMNNAQFVVNHWLTMNSSFSVGIKDCILGSTTQQRIDDKFRQEYGPVMELLRQGEMGVYQMKMGKSNLREDHEGVVKEKISKFMEMAWNIAKPDIQPDNAFLAMMNAGSKGKAMNLMQIMGCLGQQTTPVRQEDGTEPKERIPFNTGKIRGALESRTLPHFHKADLGPKARGFCANSYNTGLSPEEFYFHCATGRDGLIDTALRTSETGYIQRKLIKSLEDHKVCHDGVVRNANADVIQISYGGDGFDTTKVEKDSFVMKLQDMSLMQLVQRYQLSMDDPRWDVLVQPALLAQWREQRSEVEAALRREFDGIVALRRAVRDRIRSQVVNDEQKFNKQVELFAWMPFRVDRMVPMIRQMLPRSEPWSDLSPQYVVEQVEKLIDRVVYRGSTAPTVRDVYGHTRMLVEATLRGKLSTAQCIFDYGLNKAQFDRMIEMMEMQTRLANVAPGEMVGIIAAQSIGEPSTQFSVPKDTQVTIMAQGKPFRGNIGDFIDTLMKENPDKVVDIGHDSTVMDLPEGFQVVSVSEREKVGWCNISQISRHPANGGLVKITTKSGRTTTATLTHSFLKRGVDRILQVRGADLKVGDRVPVAKSIPVVNAPVTFVTLRDGKVLSLDRQAGWFFGSYLADGGAVAKNYASISKTDPVYLQHLEEFCTRYGWTTSLSLKEKEGKMPGSDKIYTSKTLVINSAHLADFLIENIGTRSYEKRVPSFAYTAPMDFMEGFVTGYLDGDASITHDDNHHSVRAYSVSEDIINDVMLLMAHIGVYATKNKEKQSNRQSEATAEYLHVLNIAPKYAGRLHSLGMCIPDKVMTLSKLVEYAEAPKITSHEYLDMIPELGETIAKVGKLLEMPGQSRTYGRFAKKSAIGRDTLVKYLSQFEKAYQKSPKDGVEPLLDILHQAANADVVWDEIVDLQILEDPQEYVYDFTVPGNESFLVDTGILVHNTLNTFHQAGLMTKFSTTTGVKRLKEILEQNKAIKSPKMVLYFRDPYRRDRKLMEHIQTQIADTRIRDLVDKVEVLYDPSDADTVVENDRRNLHSQIKTLRALEDAMAAEGRPVDRSSEWVLRIVFNERQIHRRRIHLWEIEQKLRQEAIGDQSKKNRYVPEFIFSDTNAQQLVLRVRLVATASQDEEDGRDIIDRLKAVGEQIQEVGVRGLVGIQGAFLLPENECPLIKKELEDGTIVDDGRECVILTTGVNFHDLCLIPGIDLHRTVTNDTRMAYDVLGIEAARTLLLRELENVFSDPAIDHRRHLDLLVDTMTFRLTDKGRLITMNRIGVRQSDAEYGPLAKASFEEMGTHFVTAGVYCDTDNFRGVSANVMAGQIFPGGTGMCRLIVDEERLGEMEPPVYTETSAPVKIETPVAVPELLTENDILESMGGIL